MDEQGFIFTTDATLALVVMIVLTASVVTYGLLPVFQGENHQHLEAIADSALETMDQDGTLRAASVEYANNNTTGAASTLQTELNLLIPSSIAYKMTMSTQDPVENDHGVSTANDIVTKVKVISGPQEGWMSRAYYKVDQVQFQNVNVTSITTLWDFHNYLKNFGPWSGGLNTYKFWGGTNNKPQSLQQIQFAVPGSLNSAQFLLGSAAGNGQTKSYGADVNINGNNNYILNTSFNPPIYTSSGSGTIYNYMKNVNIANLNNNSVNNFYVQFNATSDQNMPWFSLIADYSTSISVPVGVATDTIPFTNIAGIGQPKSLGNCIVYNPDTGSVSSVAGRTFAWNVINSTDFDTSTPFEITNVPTPGIPKGSAVASVQHINLPANRLFDAYTVVNAFGGEDFAVVQVKNSTGVWNTVFSSWANTKRTDGGYGNVPGTINILPYLTVGDNSVRIITWDGVVTNDYDLVGLENCYSKITYSKLPIRWDTFSFDSFQNDSSASTKLVNETKIFNIDQDAQNALLFLGVGGDSKSITVTVNNSKARSLLYNGTVPFDLDLGALDNAQTTKVLTNKLSNGTVALIPGNYTLTVTVSPALAYQTGSGGANVPNYGFDSDPAIFSGTRIGVIYPKFLQNVWATGYANTPQLASQNAVTNLLSTLSDSGYTNIDPSLIKNTTLYSGDVPNAVPVRLDLWTQ